MTEPVNAGDAGADDAREQAVPVAERVAARYRREFRRRLAAGVALAVVMLALGVVVVYGFGEMPGMAPPS